MKKVYNLSQLCSVKGYSKTIDTEVCNTIRNSIHSMLFERISSNIRNVVFYEMKRKLES